MTKHELNEMVIKHISNIMDLLGQLNDEGVVDEKTHDEALKRFYELVNYKGWCWYNSRKWKAAPAAFFRLFSKLYSA